MTLSKTQIPLPVDSKKGGFFERLLPCLGYTSKSSVHADVMIFCKQNLVRTVEECTSKKLTLCDAAEKYGIPKSTISRHTKSLQQRKPGGCSVIVDYLN